MHFRKLYLSTALLLITSVSTSVFSQEAAPSQQESSVKSASDIQDINLALEDLSKELFSNLDPKGTYALKNANPEDSGIPENLLKQLAASLQSSLMVASDFQINIIDQGQQNSAWANAVEFNGADFEEMVSQANFSALIILNARATNSGIDLSLQAIGATAENAGQVVSSTAMKSVSLDWSKFVSADLTDKTSKKIDDIQAELEKLKSLTEPVEAPKSFADFLHNARIHKSRGEMDTTISSLESAVKLEPKFVDVLSDLTELLVQKYGAQNAQLYIDKRLKANLGDEMYTVASLIIDPNSSQIGIGDFIDQKIKSPPLAARWLWGAGQQVLDRRSSSDGPYQYDFAVLSAARLVIRSYETGQFQTYFVDPLEASKFAKLDEAKAIEQRLNRVEYSVFTTKYERNTGNSYYDLPGVCRSSALFYPDSMPDELKLRKKTECEKYYVASRRISQSLIDSLLEHDGEIAPNNVSTQIQETTIEQIPLDRIFVSGAPDSPSIRMPCYQGPDSSETATTASLPKGSLDKFLDSRVEPSQYRELGLLNPDQPVFELEFPTVANDRLNFADFCLPRGQDIGKIVGISEFIITDDVDTEKPILVNALVPSNSDEIHSVTVDITKDGTTFSDSGLQVLTEKSEGNLTIISSPKNSWLWAPGVVQSLIGRTNIVSVSYTDISGAEKTIGKQKIFVHASDDFVSRQSLDDGFVGDDGRFKPTLIDGYTLLGSIDWSLERGDAKGFDGSEGPYGAQESYGSTGGEGEDGYEGEGNPDGATEMGGTNQSDSGSWVSLAEFGTCFPATELQYRAANINEYVSMRETSSTDAPSITRIMKDEQLTRADDTVYLGLNSRLRDACFVLCDSEGKLGTSNPSGVAECISDNALWFKMRAASGQTGYISAKFLAVEGYGE
ncbi:hypothetical protein [Paragemmobacter straminiformis]|uniref:SH3 domain-containing protein n=1 Tax=Paragemmobacter straminiformis TaxID=2045119 RepID=A0A842I6V1_9RHOB|nr:hypothetical protein [Gemmobacter straminiformis]MBC2835133.1 hypothetical protein [Gemmobacter straminiformis]